MKTLIIGSGYLGTVLGTHFRTKGEMIMAGSQEIDITDLASVQSLIEHHQPTLIINTAAFTNTNAAELPENRGKVYAVNVQGPANIAYVARKLAIPWVQLSTGMMFDGIEGGWDESALPNPTNYYSWTKFWADAQLAPLAPNDHCYILRIHTPLSATSHPRNFMNRLQKFERAIDVPSSVTIVEDLCFTIDQLLQKNAPGGIYNVVNPGIISAFTIAQLMQAAGLIAPEKNLSALTREELDLMTKTNGGAHQTFPILKTDKLVTLGIILPNAETAVRTTINNFHN